MTISVKHSKVSAKADSGDSTIVQPSDWNAAHTITMATSRMLGRTAASTGVVQEISVGTGLSLASLSLSFDITWGDNRYLQSFTETDPVFSASAAAGITSTNITNWNTAYGWGNWASNFGTTSGKIAQGNDSRILNGQTAFGWGNHASAGYAASATTITAGAGLTGGGTLAANRTIAVDFTVVRTTTAQTLTNKTLSNPTMVGCATEDVFTALGTAPSLNPADGTIQTWTLTGNSSPTINAAFESGDYMTLMIDDGSARTITWPAITWVGGSAPTLATTGYTVIELWKVGSVVYGALVGEA